MSKRITKSMIDKAIVAGACGEAVKWLREKPRTTAQLAKHDEAWTEWAVASLTSKRVHVRYQRAWSKEYHRCYDIRIGPTAILPSDEFYSYMIPHAIKALDTIK